MKLTTNDGEIYIAQREKFYKSTVRLSIFCGVYATWCFYQMASNIYEIAFNNGGFSNVLGGVIHILCLFIVATRIEELLNDI